MCAKAIISALSLSLLWGCAPPVRCGDHEIPASASPELKDAIRQLRSPSRSQRMVGADRIAELAREQERTEMAPAIPFLIDLLADGATVNWSSGATVGIHAAIALRRIGETDEAAVDALLGLLQREGLTTEQKCNAITALGTVGDTDARRKARLRADARVRETVLPFLDDSDADVRATVVFHLPDLGVAYDEAVGLLIGCLEDRSSLVRWKATSMLNAVVDPRVVEPLIRVLDDPREDVRRDALSALQRSTGRDFGHDKNRWEKWWNESKATFRPPHAKTGAEAGFTPNLI